MFIQEPSFVAFPCKWSGHVTGIEALLPCVIYLFSFLCHIVVRSLQELLDYPGEDIEETFCLNFTVRIIFTYDHSYLFYYAYKS